MKARIAQLQQDKVTERKYLDKMLSHLPSWSDDHCQSCHNNLQQKDKVPYLPLKQLWFGERYVDLMRQSGDAEAIRTRAQADLATDPKNELARLRLGYALIALGKSEQAESAFQELSYYQTAEKNLPKPRMLFAFP